MNGQSGNYRIPSDPGPTRGGQTAPSNHNAAPFPGQPYSAGGGQNTGPGYGAAQYPGQQYSAGGVQTGGSQADFPDYGAPCPGQIRTAGGGQTGPQYIPDWQRNTWQGPAPVSINPFDEPEDAPELLQERSEELSKRQGEFWQQHTDGYQFTGAENRGGRKADNKAGKRAQDNRSGGRAASGRTGVQTAGGRTGTQSTDGRTGTHAAEGASPAPGKPAAADGNAASGRPGAKPARKSKKMTRVWLILLICAAVIAGAGLFIYYVPYQVREITVTGANKIPAAEVIRLSGIRKGMPIFAVNEEQAKKGIESNLYLVFQYLNKDPQNRSVSIVVKERESCCWINAHGIIYVLDKNRMVLYETEDQTVQPDLVKVSGLNIRSGAITGQTMVLSSASQEQAFHDLFLEMKVLGCTDMIREADLSNISSLLLTTKDGITVRLGSTDELHAKLKSLMLTLAEVHGMGYEYGTIDVSNQEAPRYSPRK